MSTQLAANGKSAGTHVLRTRVSPDLYEKVRVRAERNERTVSAELRYLIRHADEQREKV